LCMFECVGVICVVIYIILYVMYVNQYSRNFLKYYLSPNE